MKSMNSFSIKTLFAVVAYVAFVTAACASLANADFEGNYHLVAVWESLTQLSVLIFVLMSLARYLACVDPSQKASLQATCMAGAFLFTLNLHHLDYYFGFVQPLLTHIQFKTDAAGMSGEFRRGAVRVISTASIPFLALLTGLAAKNSIKELRR